MIFSTALIEPLSDLTVALDDPGTDLQTILDVLCDDLSTAVSSFLGLTMTLQVDGVPVTLTAIDADLALAAGASLELPLKSLIGAGTTGTVVFYARNPGSFVDLAADTERVCALSGRVLLDGHLPSTADPPHQPGITGLADLGVINLAVGVLITRGHTPAQAHVELRRQAAENLHSVAAAARHILASTNAPPPLSLGT
jgi:hypothetical protein